MLKFQVLPTMTQDKFILTGNENKIKKKNKGYTDNTET